MERRYWIGLIYTLLLVGVLLIVPDFWRYPFRYIGVWLLAAGTLWMIWHVVFPQQPKPAVRRDAIDRLAEITSTSREAVIRHLQAILAWPSEQQNMCPQDAFEEIAELAASNREEVANHVKALAVWMQEETERSQT